MLHLTNRLLYGGCEMTKRNANVRKACRDINNHISLLCKVYDLDEKDPCILTIKECTHRIKRTTWRGEKDGHRPELRLACTCKTCLPTKPNVIFDNEKYLNGEMSANYKPTKPSAKNNYGNTLKYASKLLNTNQTTTANIDVSTIPYY